MWEETIREKRWSTTAINKAQLTTNQPASVCMLFVGTSQLSLVQNILRNTMPKHAKLDRTKRPLQTSLSVSQNGQEKRAQGKTCLLALLNECTYGIDRGSQEERWHWASAVSGQQESGPPALNRERAPRGEEKDASRAHTVFLEQVSMTRVHRDGCGQWHAPL